LDLDQAIITLTNPYRNYKLRQLQDSKYQIVKSGKKSNFRSWQIRRVRRIPCRYDIHYP